MVGVPCSTRKCALIGCVSPDGTRLRYAIITKTVTISSVVLTECGFPSNRLKICLTQNSFINNDVFGKWLCDVLLKEIEMRRAWLRERLGDYDDRAVHILDGLKCHTTEPFVELLRRHNVTVVVLVAQTSHMTQPLDVGIFGRVKNLMRQEGKYIINLHLLDREMTYQTQEENAGRPVPPERGRLLADYVVSILRSYEQATTSDNVVSAFAQVGIHSKVLDRVHTDDRVTYSDPATARVVVDEFGQIALPPELQVEPSPTWQLKISDLNSAHQSPMALQLTRELETIRAELPPRTERIATQRPTPLRGRSKNSPSPQGPSRPSPQGPNRRGSSSGRGASSRSSRSRRPRPSSPSPLSAFRRAGRSRYTHSHSDGGFEILLGNDSPQTQGLGPF